MMPEKIISKKEKKIDPIIKSKLEKFEEREEKLMDIVFGILVEDEYNLITCGSDDFSKTLRRKYKANGGKNNLIYLTNKDKEDDTITDEDFIVYTGKLPEIFELKNLILMAKSEGGEIFIVTTAVNGFGISFAEILKATTKYETKVILYSPEQEKTDIEIAINLLPQVKKMVAIAKDEESLKEAIRKYSNIHPVS